MSDRKLELKDVAGYLPYGLKVQCKAPDGKWEMYGGGILIGQLFLDFWHYGEEIRPILRPLDDLYQTVTHEGMEVVPIVELARIAGFSEDCKLLVDERIVTEEGHYFSYDARCDGFFFSLRTFQQAHDVRNQCNLWDYLHELKIDYRGLIDAGFAVSVHDVEWVVYG